jgi:hypothetical protein
VVWGAYGCVLHQVLPAQVYVQTCYDDAMEMETQNVTVRVPRTLLRKAKQLAAERGTTLTALVVEGLTRATSGDEAYREAFERQRSLMHAGWQLREPSELVPRREAAHER